jgi:hypothetical protein
MPFVNHHYHRLPQLLAVTYTMEVEDTGGVPFTVGNVFGDASYERRGLAIFALSGASLP